MSYSRMSVKQLKSEVAKWRGQTTNPKFREANISVQVHANRAYEHWCRMLEFRERVQMRRAVNREQA